MHYYSEMKFAISADFIFVTSLTPCYLARWRDLVGEKVNFLCENPPSILHPLLYKVSLNPYSFKGGWRKRELSVRTHVCLLSEAPSRHSEMSHVRQIRQGLIVRKHGTLHDNGIHSPAAD